MSGPQDMEPLAVTIAVACKLTSLSPASVNRMIARGELETRKISGRRLVPMHAIRKLLGA